MTKDETKDAIRNKCIDMGLDLTSQIAYVLATVEHETGGTFKPVREAFYVSEDFEKAEAWRRRHLRYYPYYGRGYVQLTWEDNYRKYGELLGIDLVADPDKALDPENALFILVHGMKNGIFTGAKLARFVNESSSDFYNARTVVNCHDKADHIAALAVKFQEELDAEEA